MNLEEMEYAKIKNEKHLLEKYKEILLDLKTNSFTKRIVEENYGEKIIDIYQILEEEVINNTSEIFFPGDIVLVYSNIKSYNTRKNICCDISGSEIRIGQTYLYYRPLLNNITKNSAYILKNTIKVCVEFENYLPSNIFEFEQLETNIANLLTSDDICYSELNRKYGGLSLVKLKRK